MGYSNQGYGNQAYGNQQSHDSNYDNYYQQFDGRQSNKRTQNPMMPDRGQPAKKFKPNDLPKPAQNSAKILAQLKNCPFGVNVYQSKSKKLPITEKELLKSWLLSIRNGWSNLDLGKIFKLKAQNGTKTEESFYAKMNFQGSGSKPVSMKLQLETNSSKPGV